MNIRLWDALMKNDFVFDRESYLTLRQSCYHLLQQNVPELLELRDEEVVELFFRTGESVAEYYDANPPFAPRGAVSQAWSVGSLLYIKQLLEKYKAKAKRATKRTATKKSVKK